MEKQTVFDIEEYADKARKALERMRSTQQPGERTGKGKKTDVLMAIKGDIEKLMKAGYTSQQIADALKNNDVFGILPKTITQLVRKGEAAQDAKKRRNTKQKTEAKPKAVKDSKQSAEQGAGSFNVEPDSEDL